LKVDVSEFAHNGSNIVKEIAFKPAKAKEEGPVLTVSSALLFKTNLVV